MTTGPNITEIEEAYKKFLRLYERFAAERLIISKQGETLVKIIEELKIESSLATEFKVQVREGILESVGEVVKEMNVRIKESIQQSVTEELNKSLIEFKNVIDNGTKILRDYAKDRKLRNIWIYCGVFFCGFIFLLTTYTTTKIWKYLPNTYLSASQIAVYEDGLVLKAISNKVSKKTWEYLIRVWLGTIPAEENSKVWIRDKNPSMSDEEIQKKFKEGNS